MKAFLEGFIAGGLLVWAVYHWNLQPKLRSERDAALTKLRDRLGKQ